jgi:hypothetical protein
MIRMLMAGVVVVFLLSVMVEATEPQPDTAGSDARAQFPPSAAHVHGRAVPKLSALRAAAAESAPVPGGLGAGTLYPQGSLPINSRAELYTQMIVHPNGINVPNWIFTTATNRTQMTIEVVGIYLNNGASLGIFDWSCMPGYPCPNQETSASWQWTKDLTDLACYYRWRDDGGGHLHYLLSYINQSQRRGNGTAPPAPVPNWKNSVLLFNECTQNWDMVYSHDFRADQQDCSLQSFACGWWGPIIETFNADPQPLINELGFLGSYLRYDNHVSTLGPSDTVFSTPNTPWIVFHLDPNRSWGVGSFTTN